MHPLQEERIKKLEGEAISIEAKEREIYKALSQAISDKESFSTILMLSTDYGMQRFRFGYTTAEIVYTKYPIRYEN